VILDPAETSVTRPLVPYLQTLQVTPLLSVSDHEIHCVSKNWGTHIMSHNSRIKCGPILIILSLLHTQMNCRKRLNKIYHLTLNLLPHYRVEVECSTLLLYSTLFNANVTQNHLLTLQYLPTRDAKFCFICLSILICNHTTCV